ncbi:MAG: hypothetical protein IJZ73_05170 [Clostridia bacterium]|nr:hypothetical protein [Clostridia bacterium]
MAKIVVKDKKEKALRHRGLKNFFIWLSGVFSPLIIFALVVAICGCLIPLGTYFGKDPEKVSDNVTDKTLLEVVMNYKDLKAGDFPILVDALESLMVDNNVDDYVEIDLDAIKDIPFAYSDGENNFGTELMKHVKVTASVNSLNLSSMLGTFSKLTPFKQWTPVPADKVVNLETLEGTEYVIYYYVPSKAGETPTDDEYKRVFTLDDDDHVQWADDTGAQLAAQNGELYYVNLAVIPITEMIGALPDSIAVLKVTELLNSLGGATITEDSLIADVLGDSTVSEIGELSVDSVKLEKLLGPVDTENKKMYDILCQLADVSSPSDLTVGDLMDSDLNVDDITLTTVIPVTGNEDLYDILVDQTGKAAELIVIGDLSSGNISVNNVKLETVLDRATHTGLYKLLDEAIIPADATKGITIGDLANMTIDNVHLDSIITIDNDPASPTYNGEIFDILLQVTRSDSYDDLTIAALRGEMHFDEIKIATVVHDSESLFEMLGDLYADPENVTLGDLKTFDPTNIHLGVVLKESANPDLYKLLNEAVDWQKYKTDNGITDASFNSAADMRVCDLETYFNVLNVKLKSVLGESSENKILNALLQNDGTIASIGEDIDNLSLTTIFEAECFITADSPQNDFITADTPVYYKHVSDNAFYKDTYVASLDGFTIDPNSDFWDQFEIDTATMAPTKYYMNKYAGALFLMYYHGDQIEQTQVTYGTVTGYVGSGLAGVYAYKGDITLKNFQTAFGNIATELNESTVRELWDLGLLSSSKDYSRLYAYTVRQALDVAATSFPDLSAIS